jgi:hypothetical protein
MMPTGQPATCTFTAVTNVDPVAPAPLPTQLRARVRGANAPAVTNTALLLIVTVTRLSEGERPFRPVRLVRRALSRMSMVLGGHWRPENEVMSVNAVSLNKSNPELCTRVW